MEEIQLQTIKDPRGSLTVAEKLPFEIKRVYYLHGCSAGRGGHAQRNTDRLLIATSGSFHLQCRTAKGWDSHRLNEPSIALRVPPMTWVELYGFSPDAVCLVIASTDYDEDDSIRDFADFLRDARRVA